MKLLLRGSAQHALQAVAGSVHGNWLNIELPEVRALRLDLLFETVERTLIQIELQTANDPAMALRMGEYCLAIYRLFGRFPRQIVLYVGNAPLSMKSELFGRDLSFRYKLVDIREFDGEELLDSPAIGDNVIAILARLPDHRAAVRRILNRIARLEPAERSDALVRWGYYPGCANWENSLRRRLRKWPFLKISWTMICLAPYSDKDCSRGAKRENWQSFVR